MGQMGRRYLLSSEIGYPNIKIKFDKPSPLHSKSMNSRSIVLIFGILLVVTASFSGCVAEPTPLEENEIGEISVVVTIDFSNRGNETANLEEQLTNGSITFEPVLIASGTTAYRVMEALQIRENFTMDVTFYTFGPYIHTIDGVAGNSDTYWSLEENGTASMVGAGDLEITADSNLAWVLASSAEY